MSIKNQFRSLDYVEWFSIGVVVASIIFAGCIVLKLITGGG
jgi:hypothetical protein